MVPRVLSDLFWFGRYAERAEDLLRLVLATRTLAIETDLDVTQGRALEVLLQAVTQVSTTYPGFLHSAGSMMPEFRSLLLDRHRAGTAAQSLGALSLAAQGVRDQLSDDVWMVLAEIDRALGALARPPVRPGPAADRRERTGPLRPARPGRHRQREHGPRPRLVHARLGPRARTGAPGPGPAPGHPRSSSAPPRPTGWWSRPCSRRPSRSSPSAGVTAAGPGPRPSSSCWSSTAQPALGLLPAAPDPDRPPGDPEHLAHGAPAAAAGQPGRAGPDRRPGRTRRDCRRHRPALGAFLGGLQGQLRDLSGAIRDQYQQQPPTQQPLFRPSGIGGGAMTSYRIEHQTTYTYDADVTGATASSTSGRGTWTGRPARRTRSTSTPSRPTCSGTPTSTATPSRTSMWSGRTPR